MKCPCKGCNDRFPACHGRCEKYIAWRVEQDNMKAAFAAEFYDPLRNEKQKRVDWKLRRSRKAGYNGN